jgi:hypothetical protein
MTDINSSLDEILAELGDTFDKDISSSQRKIVRSTANKIWLILRAFARGLYGVYQAIAALRYKFDPLYCTDEELESTMRITGTTLRPGKATLLTVLIWNNHISETKTFPAGTYTYTSANGITFMLELPDDVSIPNNSFMKRDFYSSLSDAPYIGSFPVSDNTGISVLRTDAAAIDSDFSFDCEDNEAQLGYKAETLFEARQRILSDNKRQEILHILEERLLDLPNIHECTIISNYSLSPIGSPYLQDDGVTPVPIVPQSILVILTGSPTSDFAKEFLTLCPFITTVPTGVADYGTVYYQTDVYTDGFFPVHYVKHKIEYFDIVIKYGFISRQAATVSIENELRRLLLSLKASTRYKEIITTEEIFKLLSVYQNPSVRILSISFNYKNVLSNYIRFNKTQIARLNTVSFQQGSLWE